MDPNASISSTILPARIKIPIQLSAREVPFFDPININYEQNEQNSNTIVYDDYKYKAKIIEVQKIVPSLRLLKEIILALLVKRVNGGMQERSM
ncbi:2863_t:CDS:2, partial [Gigaspora rosea]